MNREKLIELLENQAGQLIFIADFIKNDNPTDQQIKLNLKCQREVFDRQIGEFITYKKE